MSSLHWCSSKLTDRSFLDFDGALRHATPSTALGAFARIRKKAFSDSVLWTEVVSMLDDSFATEDGERMFFLCFYLVLRSRF